MKFVSRMLTLGVLAAGLALVGASPANASAGVQSFPPPPPRICDFFITSVTADDVLNDGGTDAVFLKMGTQSTVNTVDFVAGQTQTSNAFLNPFGFFVAPAKLPVSLHVKAGSLSAQIGTTINVSCIPATGAQLAFSNGDARYRVTYDVTVEILEI